MPEGIQGCDSVEDGVPCPQSMGPLEILALFSPLGYWACRHDDLHSLLPRSSRGGDRSGQRGHPLVIGGRVSCYAIFLETIDDCGYMPHYTSGTTENTPYFLHWQTLRIGVIQECP